MNWFKNGFLDIYIIYRQIQISTPKSGIMSSNRKTKYKINTTNLVSETTKHFTCNNLRKLFFPFTVSEWFCVHFLFVFVVYILYQFIMSPDFIQMRTYILDKSICLCLEKEPFLANKSYIKYFGRKIKRQ